MTGEELKALRKAKDWTQAELAKALDLSQSGISDMENGDRPISRRDELAIRSVLKEKK